MFDNTDCLFMLRTRVTGTVQSRYSERKYSEQSRFSEPFAVSHFIIVME